MIEEIYNPDADLENADWAKRTWDLPPYKSAEFDDLGFNLENFRKLPVYKNAVASGLIVDDKWVGVTAGNRFAAKMKGLQ